MNEDPARARRIDRRLRAGWAGYERLDGRRRDWALETLGRAYPEVRTQMEVVVLSSVHRRSEVLHLANDDHLIVLDTGYTSAVATVARLTAAGARHSDAVSDAALAGLLGWALVASGDPATGSVLVAQSLRRSADMVPLQHPLTPDPSVGTGIFVLLHEGTHALAASEAFDGDLHRTMVKTTAGKFAEAAAAMMADIRAGTSRDGSEFGGIIPEDPEDIAHFRWQFDAYKAAVDASSDLTDEMLCDLVALCAILDLRFGTSIVASRYPALPTDRLHEVGDVLMVGLRSLRAMQMVSLLRSEATAHLRGGRIGSFSPNFAELMARQQTATAMASSLFAFLSEMSDTRNAAHMPGDYVAAFSHALTSLLGAQTDPVLDAANRWFDVLRDAKARKALESEVEADVARFASGVGIARDDYVGVASGLMKRLSF